MAKVLLGWRLLHYLPLVCYKNQVCISSKVHWFFIFIAQFCLQFLSLYKVTQLRIPTLFISGMADTLVPPRMMSELHNRCGSERKQLLQLPLGTHNETWTLQGYYHSLAMFLQNCRSADRVKKMPEDESTTGHGNAYSLYKVQTI